MATDAQAPTTIEAQESPTAQTEAPSIRSAVSQELYGGNSDSGVENRLRPEEAAAESLTNAISRQDWENFTSRDTLDFRPDSAMEGTELACADCFKGNVGLDSQSGTDTQRERIILGASKGTELGRIEDRPLGERLITEDPFKYDEGKLERVDETKERGDVPPLDEAVRNLKELTDGKMGVDQESFDKNLEKFLQSDHSDQMKAEAIKNLTDMLQAADNGEVKHKHIGEGQELSDNMRKFVAGSMDNIANPRDIDQYNTKACNASTVEEQLSGQNPAMATSKLKEVMVNGTFTGEGTFGEHRGESFTARVPEGIFKAALGDVGNYTQSQNEIRNSASTALQGGMINHFNQQKGMYYTEVENPGQGDSGERLMHMNADGSFSDRNVKTQNRDGSESIAKSPSADIYDVAAMAKASGVQDVAIMTSSEYAYKGSVDGVTVVNNAAELQAAMQGKKGGIIGGNSGDRLLTGKDNLVAGGHVFSIYNNGDGSFFMSDQYGSQRDRTGVSAEALASFTKGAKFRMAGGNERLADSDYGIRADGKGRGYGYNAATDGQTIDYDQLGVDRGGRGQARYYEQDDPGLYDEDDRRNLQAPENEEGEDKKKDDKKDEEEPEKKAELGSDNTYRIAQLRDQIARAQVALDNAPDISHLLGELSHELSMQNSRQA